MRDRPYGIDTPTKTRSSSSQDEPAGPNVTTGGPRHIPTARSVVPGMHTIEAHQLRKTYPGGVEAVRGIDFTVDPGEVFGLLGPNGAGKSTTIGMLTTTVIPT